MKTLGTNAPEQLAIKQENIIQMPLGLIGFEKVKNFVLLANPEEDPFLWLQMVEDGSRAFLCISPFLVLPDYQPDVTNEDIKFLGITNPADALVINIVTLRPNGKNIVNLKGPVVLNRHTLIGKQVILSNAPQYSVQHPLPVAN